MAPLKALGASSVQQLADWSDYLYEASALATLSGKKLGKKRNHVNRFEAENPGYTFEPLHAIFRCQNRRLPTLSASR